MQISMTVNGGDAVPRRRGADAARAVPARDCGLTGTKVGCDTSSCGACTVLVDGESVKSCTMLAAQADGAAVTTIEGLAGADAFHPVQQAFHEQHGLQCGYCTAGMVMAAVGFLDEHPTRPSARSGSVSRATSAAAPATTTSCRRCSPRPTRCGRAA